jgi:hypothetical protein
MKTARQESDYANSRLNSIMLMIAAACESPGFACGIQQVEGPENLKFMHVSRDGMGCNVFIPTRDSN